MSDDKAPEWEIISSDGENFTSRCPHCKDTGSIVEVDRAVRWNTLNFLPDHTAVANLGDHADFDFYRWMCTSCLSEELSAPEGFEIVRWD